ncbi:MAG: hypothetical protein PQJ50_15390 [Spirochaetales bacterium]|nr:hypothetical protein [Spirochaetales bacterium]
MKKYISKKVIFVYPPEHFRGTVMETLTGRDYEVYTLKDHDKIAEIYSRYPDSIFFINIDTGMSIVDWEFFIMTLSDRCHSINIGIITFNRSSDRRVVETFIGQLNVNCGIIEIKQRVSEVTGQLLKVLEANEVKGMNRIVRCNAIERDKNRINFPMNGLYINGNIMDLGISGFTCTLEKPVPFMDRQLIQNIQVRLNGIIISGDCYYISKKEVNSELLYIFAFHPDYRLKVGPKIQKYIYSSLQSRFNREFALDCYTVPAVG